MMKIEPYTHREHYARLAGWLAARGIPIPQPELFSDSGFIVDDCAIGFLFRTPSRQAYIDHVAADPGVSMERREAALGALLEHLEDVAKRDSFLMVTALASLPAMRRRFEGRGYARHGEYGLYYKVLGG